MTQIAAPGMGAGPGAMAKSSYTALADSVKIGGLEFKDCEVNVNDEAARSMMGRVISAWTCLRSSWSRWIFP